MTILELMKRVAGDDLEWTDLNMDMVHEMGDAEVMMAVLTGYGPARGQENTGYIFRLPVEKLRKRPQTKPGMIGPRKIVKQTEVDFAWECELDCGHKVTSVVEPSAELSACSQCLQELIDRHKKHETQDR